MTAELPPPAPSAYTILVADDDARARETLAGVLADRGFSTRTATSGEEALDIVRVDLVHLVFFDMHLPRMTGLEAFEQVRVFNEILPAILLTAEVSRELMRQAHQARMTSVIPKPVNQAVVIHTLTRVLHRVYGDPPAAGADAPPQQ